jgi:predicted site-specific integrase-resolvase
MSPQTPKTELRQTLNNSEVADLFDISRVTLNRWIKDGKIPEPMTNPTTKQKIWTQADIEAIGRYLERQRKGSE